MKVRQRAEKGNNFSIFLSWKVLPGHGWAKIAFLSMKKRQMLKTEIFQCRQSGSELRLWHCFSCQCLRAGGSDPHLRITSTAFGLGYNFSWLQHQNVFVFAKSHNWVYWFLNQIIDCLAHESSHKDWRRSLCWNSFLVVSLAESWFVLNAESSFKKHAAA